MPIKILSPIRHSPSPNLRKLRGRKLQETRLRIFVEHDFTCADCKMIFPMKYLELDHRVDLSFGGTDHDSNLQPLCLQCHKKKTADRAVVQKVF